MTDTAETNRLWQHVLVDLEERMARGTFDTCLRGTRLQVGAGGVYTVAARSPSVTVWLQNRLDQLVKDALAHHVGVPVEVQYS